MSERTVPSAAPWLIAVGGIVLLAMRLPLLSLPDGARVVVFATLFGTIGVASWLVPAARTTTGCLPSAAVLAIGLASVLLAAGVAGRPPGLPIGAWALPLGLGAAVAEELLFRRLAYAALARRSEIIAVVVTAVAFALVHLPLYGLDALPVDLGAGLLFSWQRWASGSWAVPAATHAAANLLAVMR